MPDSILAQVLVGLYLGALTGVLPALVSWALGFSFRYVTGVTVPGLGVVVVAAAIAGVSGGLLGLLDPAISETPVGVVAALVVLMASFWAHNQGDKMGEAFPRRITLESIRRRTLSGEVVDRVGRFGQVRVRVTNVEDVEGYPPLPAGVREKLEGERFSLPADLPLSELETRVRDRLRSSYDLETVSVSLDRRANATVAAAPALGGFSRRVPAGQRAVSVETLVPAGADRGDRALLWLPETTVEGHVLGVGEPSEDDDRPTRRLTVAVSPGEVEAVLAAEEVRVAVLGEANGRDLLARLKAAGLRVRTLESVRSRTVDPTALRSETGAQVFAVRGPAGLRVPDGPVRVRAGEELLAVGTPDALRGLREVVA
ncbi:potassium transporter TrkA [Halalkalicoccus sp. NIPERK01]|uniref:potassium transporter TrkA n=1 Tax=Halalkalicoccus sp. NIPERK01 TaxID=3053469 RepID=UPI00256EA6E6|nr:potassium transporter TrkA [Halalkalicoccus sp. NIPERK01]MDL5362700.1 potassium transporter TrkA [Halalkalicoccus sp. NIPERK01]